MTVSHATDPQPSSTGGKIHPATDYVVADASALAALTTTSTDLYKLAYQVSPPALYLLIGTGPALWKKLGIAGALATSEVVNDASAFGTSGAAATSAQDALNELAAWNPLRAQLVGSRPQTGGLTFSNVGGSTQLYLGGTVTDRGILDTNYSTRRHRVGFLSASTPGSVAGVQFFHYPLGGPAQRNAGFDVWGGGVLTQFTASSRWFMGLSGTSSPATDPRAFLNMVGIGSNAAGNVQLWVNDGAGTATAVDLGASFPARTVDAVYDWWFACLPGASAIRYRIRRLDVPAMVSGTLTTDLPVASTSMFVAEIHNNNADTGVVGIDCFGYEAAIPFG